MRWRVNGHPVEKAFRKRADAETFKRKVESAEVAGISIDLRAGMEAMILLAGFGGLRLGELLYLQRQHVDLLHRTVKVEGQLIDRSKGGRVRTQPKSKAGRRVVSIDPITCAALEVQLATWSNSGPEGAVFTDEAGGVPMRTTFNRRWQEAARSPDSRRGCTSMTSATPPAPSPPRPAPPRRS